MGKVLPGFWKKSIIYLHAIRINGYSFIYDSCCTQFKFITLDIPNHFHTCRWPFGFIAFCSYLYAVLLEYWLLVRQEKDLRKSIVDHIINFDLKEIPNNFIWYLFVLY